MIASGEVGVLPIHTPSDGIQRHKSKSKRTKSSNPLRASDPPRSDRTPKAPTVSDLHGSRPGAKPRTNSAPSVSISKTQPASESTGNQHSYSYRDSVTSIKDDPFFRNYQTPQSISLARELRSASHGRKDDVENPPAWSKKRSTAGSPVTGSVRHP